MLALLIAAAVGAEPAETLTLPTQLTRPGCPERILRYTNQTEEVQTRRLGDLPPAVLMHTVDKRIDGCSVNVLMRRDALGRKMIVPGGSARFVPAPVSGPQRRR